MSRYQTYVYPPAWAEIAELPGHVKQRVRRAIDSLAVDPQPSQSKALTVSRDGIALYRLRLDRWRILYAVNPESKLIQVLAVRKRPPYDYNDLDKLLQQLL